MRRAAFEQLVRETAYRPTDRDALLADLHGQLEYLPESRADGLGTLADALAIGLSAGAESVLPDLSRLAGANPKQPLCQFYLAAARREVGDAGGEREAVAALARADPTDPMAGLLRLKLDGQPVPTVTEEVRLANIAKLAASPLLRNPYRLAVGAIFEAIRDRDQARVLDVGVGSGAQMSELLDLMEREEHAVRRLEIVALDFVGEFLEAAGERIAARAAALGGAMEVAYRPVRSHVQELDEAGVAGVLAHGPLDAANATIALHEVPGEAKLSALRNLRRLAPRLLVVAEWNYCLENLLPETRLEFLFNVRRVTAAMVGALRERHPLEEARAVVRDWLSLAGGQLTCPASERQECFLDVMSWEALLHETGFSVRSPDRSLLAYLNGDERGARIEGSYLATSRYANATPIALLEASPA